MVSKGKSGKMSTSKKGEKDTDKVVDNPIKNVIDSKEKEETVEDARKLAEVTKLFRNLAQGYALGKRNSQQCGQEDVNIVSTNMHNAYGKNSFYSVWNS